MGFSKLWFSLGFCLASASGWCGEDIVDVLRRSQDQRLQAQVPAAADSARAAIVRRSFQTLIDGLQAPAPALELRIVSGPLVAETLHGHIIVVNESLADMPETARLFILAHELGHVVMGHWLQVALLYQKWVPGPVTPAHTDPVAAQLGREGSSQAHAHEYEADAYAGRLLQRLGWADEDQLAMFRHLGLTNDTATHPSTKKRMASLRAGLAGLHASLAGARP